MPNYGISRSYDREGILSSLSYQSHQNPGTFSVRYENGVVSSSGYNEGEYYASVVRRNGKTEIANTTLKNRNNSTEIIEVKDDFQKKLGLEVQPLSNAEHNKYQINSGLRVSKLNRGLIAQRTALKPGFIILSINEEEVKTENDLSRILSRNMGSTIIIEGFYPNKPYTFQYAFKLN